MIEPLLALLLAGAAPTAAQDESAWPTNETAHFVIHHESPGAALGDYAKIERLYERLHAELWTLVPWRTDAKTHVYVYKDVDSYRRGRFHPPSWSGGLMRSSGAEKELAVFAPLDEKVVAHELTHLYFHSYFGEKGAVPPAWLDEGLASMFGDQALSLPDPRLRGPILPATVPLALFVESRPAEDAPEEWVGAWYRQAQSVAWFLKRGRIESGFAGFCAKLRDGRDVESALREAYGDVSLAAFEAEWQRWRPTKPAGALKGLGDQ